MTLLKFHLLILVASFPVAAWAEAVDVATPKAPVALKDLPDEFDPASATGGTLPSPVTEPRTPSPVPKSGIFYILPILGLWMILRRRSHRGTNG